MNYVTLSYVQSQESEIQTQLRNIQFYSQEIKPKICMKSIPGLNSRSFSFRRRENAEKFTASVMNIPLWIKHGSKAAVMSSSQSQHANSHGNLTELSFGYFKSIKEYHWAQQKIDDSLSWSINVKKKYMSIMSQTEEFRLTNDCMWHYFLKSTNTEAGFSIFVCLKNSPKCYQAQGSQFKRYTRALIFDEFGQQCLKKSDVILLRFPGKDDYNRCFAFLTNIIKLECHEADIVVNKMRKKNFKPNLEKLQFWSRYAYEMLSCLGYRIENEMTQETFEKINKLANVSCKTENYFNLCYSTLVACYFQARKNLLYDINKQFDTVDPLASSQILNNWSYVPRIFLTPYGVYPLPMKPMRENRILRETERFGPWENFCRVIVRDTDLSQPQAEFIKIADIWLLSLFKEERYIVVGGRQYRFLLCSNSQLKDRSFWFYASYNHIKPENIRQWMGDFSKEKCVGTRIARMALSLTGTTATIKLSPDQIKCIDDKTDSSGRTFTDGIGKISPVALEKALEMINPKLISDRNNMPCVIQARLNGIKGVFVCAPDLANTNTWIQYRPSQHKFDVNHNVLEIVKYATSGSLFLNRQIIMLLENMKVPQVIFLKLQNRFRYNISMALLANDSALHMLEQHVSSFNWSAMCRSGIQLTKEPFIRSLLNLLTKFKLKRLKEKSHVPISSSNGRVLMGVVDENNSLEYGQVFIQLNSVDGKRKILTDCQIIVSKNPAHFPGDVRILDAVDCPDLHHLSECVVFPAKGPRPHPNEISGSDLDGDEYWICWDKEIVGNVSNQYPPADFQPVEKVKHNGHITMEDIANFLYKYLSSDSLGALSNRHLACCDKYGPNHENSLRLAKIISDAVDFPKTGVLPEIPRDIQLDEYPDYMENKYKSSFESESAIGTMYRQLTEVWDMHLNSIDEDDELIIEVDEDFLIEGFEEHLEDAKEHQSYYVSALKGILSVYNLENEYELITGCHSCDEEEKKNNDSVETALAEFRSLTIEMRRRFKADELNPTKDLTKASAWYYVAYKSGTMLSFAWIMSDLLSNVIKRNKRQVDRKGFKQIAKRLQERGLLNTIEQISASYAINEDKSQFSSDEEKIGYYFVKIIEKIIEVPDLTDFVHYILLTLHSIALET